MLRSEAPTEIEQPKRRGRPPRAALAAGLAALVGVGVAAVAFTTTRDDPASSSSKATPTATATETPSKLAAPTVETLARVARRPNSIAVGNGLVFATSYYSGRVTLLDERTGKRRRPSPSIGVGGRDSAPGLGAVWVALSRQNALVKLDPATGKQLARIALPNRPQTISAGHGAVWVGMSTKEGSSTQTPAVPDSLAKIDPDSHAVTQTYPMAGGIRYLTATPQGVWIVNRGYSTVSRFDPRAGKLDKRVIIGAPKLGGIAHGAGAVWVVVPAQDTVVRIDDKSGKQVSIGVGRHPAGIAARGRQIWVTSFIDHTLTRIDPKTSRPAGKPIPVPLNPYALAVTDDSVWLTAVGRNEIARFRYRAAAG
jgi:streptogramin lyase